MMTLKLLCGIFFLLASTSAQTYNAVETEMFSIPISPNLFNWTYQEFDEQYRFHASLKGKPELPSWLRYIYSARHHSGFIFGTPPPQTQQPVIVEIVGLNKQDYETRRVLLKIDVKPKEKIAQHEVELKIDNLNVEDLLDEHRMTRLKDILRTKLWTESIEDLYPTFLASAIDLGARLPLKPSDGEGLVVRLGSSRPFSEEIKRVREEVRPLSRLPSCPREYKRTTVERFFRDAGFTLDWCRFELYNTYYKGATVMHHEYLAEVPTTKKPTRMIADLGEKSYYMIPTLYSPRADWPNITEIMNSIIIPMIFLLVLMATVTALVCNQAVVGQSQEIPVELCKYPPNNTNNAEQNDLGDSEVTKSIGVSPNNSLVRPYSPKSTPNLASSYNRPQPPPYGTTSNSLQNRKSYTSDNVASSATNTLEKRHLALEDSLKLLNEAKITSGFDNLDLKNSVMDIDDASEDYIPLHPEQNSYVQIKPDSKAYVAIKQDIDDSDLPIATKFGLGTLASPM